MANKPGQKQPQQGQKPKLAITGTVNAAVITITGKPSTEYAFVLGTTPHPFQAYLTDPTGGGYSVTTDTNGLYRQPNGSSVNLTACPDLSKFQTISVIKVGEPGSISDPIELSTLGPAAAAGPSPFTAPGAPKPAITLTCSNPTQGFGYHHFNFTVAVDGGIQPYRIRTSAPSDYYDRAGTEFTAAPMRRAVDVTAWEVIPPMAGNTDNFSVAPVMCYSLLVWVELVATGEPSNKITVETTTNI